MLFQSAHSEEYSSIFKSDTITDLKSSNVEMFSNFEMLPQPLFCPNTRNCFIKTGRTSSMRIKRINIRGTANYY